MHMVKMNFLEFLERLWGMLIFKVNMKVSFLYIIYYSIFKIFFHEKKILLDLQIVHFWGPVHLLVHVHITHALPS